MKLYFGNMVTTVTTLMIVSLVGFVGYSVSNRSSINFWGRRSLFVLAYGLVICCFAAAIIIVAAIATPIAKSQHMREIWFYRWSGLLDIQSVAETTLMSGAEGACLFWYMVLLYAASQLQETDWIKQFSIR